MSASFEMEHQEEHISALDQTAASFTDGAAACGEGKMSLRSAIFNLTNTIIGSGTLTMPFIFAQVGWLPANILCVVILLATAYSAYLLVGASDRVGGVGARSYEALGYKCCGVFGSVCAQCTFICGGIGTLTGYMIFIGTLLTQVFDLDRRSTYIPILVVAATVILPLALPRNVNSLEYASMGAVLTVIYVVIMYIVLWATIVKYDDDPAYVYKDVEVAVWSAQSINSVNLLFGAFCVQNTVLPIYSEMQHRSPRRLLTATMVAMCISYAVYELIALSGYSLFGGGVQSNSLLNFDGNFKERHPWTRPFCAAAKISMAVLLSLSFPLALWPCRSAICSVVIRARNGCSGPALGSDFAGNKMFRGVTIGITVTVAVLAILIPDVAIPLGVVNSIAGGSIIFVMPGIFSLCSIEDKSQRYSLKSWPMYGMIVVGIGVSVVGFTLEVASIVKKYG